MKYCFILLIALVGCSSPGVVVRKTPDGTTTVIASSPSIFEDALADTYQVEANIEGVGAFSINSQKLEKDQTEAANAYFTAEVAKRAISSSLSGKRSDNSVKKVNSNNSVRKAKIAADKELGLKALEHPIE